MTQGIPGYASVGNFAKVAEFFTDPNTGKQYSALEAQKNATKFNPPMPSVVDGSRYLNNPRGFILRDPMPVTGYAPATANSETGESNANPTPDDNPGNNGSSDYLMFDALKGDNAYGFRFLMNPTNFSEGFSNTTNVDPIGFRGMIEQSSEPPAPIMSGASMKLELMLTRIDDMRILRLGDQEALPYYRLGTQNPVPFEEMREGILTRGTMYDLEYLFRTINGKPFPVWWSDTPSSDWGPLFPRPVFISVGDTGGVGYTGEVTQQVRRFRRIRGFVNTLNISHLRFAPGMVPILTKISLDIERFSDALYKGIVWDSEDVDGVSAGDR